MMRRPGLALALAAVAGLTLAACTEKPQTMGSNPNDVSPYTGTKYPYASPGWSAGDQRSWQEQLRVRTQRGQNEYTRM